MDPVILHLPIKYSELINTIYCNSNIEDFLNESKITNSNEFLELDDGDNLKLDIYKIGENITDTLFNKQTFSNEINKNIILDTIIDINYNNQDFIDIKPYNISIDTIKKSKTNISCWWCCHKFDNYPISLPIKFYPENKLFKCKGIYCSFSCALSYAQEKKYNYNLLKLLYRQLLNVKFSESINIKKAPPKEILEMFGGPVTIEEYRKNCGNDNINLYNITTYPIIFVNQQLHLKTVYGKDSKKEINSKRILNEYMINESQKRLISTETKKNGNSVLDKLNSIKLN